MKKLTLFLLATLVGITISTGAYAHEGNANEPIENKIIEPCEEGSVILCGDHGVGNSQTIDEVLNDLLVGFDVERPQDLDCSEIVDHDFSHMGEAIMLYMHPDKDRLHSVIDALGGEGSDSLTTTRAEIGKRYLGCEDAKYGPLMMHNLYNTPANNSPQAIGLPSHMFWANQSWMLLIWILALIGLITSIQLIINKTNKK